MEKKGLNNTTIWLMVGVALFYDALTLIPFAGLVVTPLAFATFWLWFEIKGVKFFSLKRAPLLGISGVIELIPGIDMLPTITLAVLRVALDSKIKQSVSKSVL